MSKFNINTRRVLMRCTSSGSNKFYDVMIEEYRSTFADWRITTRYGKCVGDWENEGGHQNTKVLRGDLIEAYNKLLSVVNSKLNKGYYIVNSNDYITPPEPKPNISDRDLLIQRLVGGRYR